MEFAKRLTALAQWLEQNHLADAAAYAEVNRLRYQLSSQQVMVAVIAEFSRGKSELINALFFAHYGRRILPAGAGRTTMCPAEIAWNPALPIGIRLLPIGTRKEMLSMAHWRVKQEAWVSFPFDTEQPDEMARTIGKISQVQRVSVEEAARLGFWFPDDPSGERNPNNPALDSLGQLEVPMWRHACINIPHPLLEQGLVILDTPGLNAVGVEPDLTMALLGQAQATLFILGADTGVTKSDLGLWREHLDHAAAVHIPRYAILNKMDTLWDDLKTEREVQQELDVQCNNTAQLLGVSPQTVVAVSAKMGLIAKIRHDQDLLMRSGLPHLESLLGQHLVRQRQTIIQQNCVSGMTRLQSTAARALERRYRELAEQKAQLQSVVGKSAQNLRMMMMRMELEKREVADAADRFQDLQRSCLKGVDLALGLISIPALTEQVDAMREALGGRILKMGLKQKYEDEFAKIKADLLGCEAQLVKLYSELFHKLKIINTQHGFAVAFMPVPSMTSFIDKLENVRLTHLHHLDISNSWRLLSKDHMQRVFQTLLVQVRIIFETAQAEIEQWSQVTIQVLQTELRERQMSLSKRISSVSGVHGSSVDTEGQIKELDAQMEDIKRQGARLVVLAKGGDSQSRAAAQMPLAV